MKLMKIFWKMCWMLSILILVLKVYGEPLKLIKSFISAVLGEVVREIILNLGDSKATPVRDIPADMLKSLLI